jgi:hypothetical protein
MKILYSLFAFLILCYADTFAQSHEWEWAKGSVMPDNNGVDSWVFSVTTDAVGNVYSAGYFYADSISFGAYTLHNTDLSEYTRDLFLVKYDPAGNVLWAKKLGGNTNDYAASVHTDPAGNVYIVGAFFSDSLLMDGHVLYNYGPTDTTCDLFIAKYNSTGTLLWAKSYGGDYYDGADAVTVDPLGYVYVSGYFQSDSITLGTTTLHDASGVKNHNALIIKLDSIGNVLWVSSSTSQGGVEAYSIATAQADAVFVTGRFAGASVQFGSTALQNSVVGYNDIFLVKYDSAGNVLWGQDAGGDYNDWPYGVAADAQGNSYITGYYTSNTAYFGSDVITNDSTNEGEDVFIAKYDLNGNAVWARSAGGKNDDVGRAVAVDTSGNVYVTGFFYSPTLFVGNQTITNYSNVGTIDDVFVIEYDKNGSVVNTIGAGSASYDAAFAITTDLSENLYVGGFFRSDNISFGTNRLDNNTPVHNTNSFIAKYSCIAPATPTITVSGDSLVSSSPANNHWYLNGNPVNHAGGQVYVPAQGGTYTVEVDNGPACRAMSAGLTTTGITDLSIAAVSLYPNPAINTITAQSDIFLSGNATATVYDVAGNAMMLKSIRFADKMIFDVSNLASGMYWIRLTSDSRESRVKFIKIPTEK